MWAIFRCLLKKRENYPKEQMHIWKSLLKELLCPLLRVTFPKNLALAELSVSSAVMSGLTAQVGGCSGTTLNLHLESESPEKSLVLQL